jgi:mevalonate kinase
MKISCPGKIILMGEHAVVYGKPAIVAAVNRRMTATVKVDGDLIDTHIKSQIPIGAGMGSSAALSVVYAAIKYALRGKTNLSSKVLSKINQLAFENEKIYHVNPSGVDPTICTYGGILRYKKTKSGNKIFKRLNLKRIPKFVLINTGQPHETTGQMVALVGKLREKEKKKVDRLFDVIEQQTKLFLLALEKRDGELLKNCIQNCQSCLEDLGVVSLMAKEIVREVEKIGGAAKICGGGGIKKGTGLLLCFHQEPEKILALGKKQGWDCFQVKFGVEGLKIDAR